MGILAIGIASLMMLRAVPEQPGCSKDEQEAKRKRTWEQVRLLVAELHARLPREHATAIGAAYARYSSRDQDSVVDQIRTILEDAERKRIFIPLEHVFFDMGVRGAKAEREGLQGLEAVLMNKSAKVAMFFSTNRLFRKTYRSLQFVEENIVERGLRAIFVKSHIDTSDGKRWRSVLGMFATMDEFVITIAGDSVRAAHEGLFKRRVVFGTISFGYRGEPIPGELTRRNRPRMRLAIDPATSEWVLRCFHWYVRDHVSINEIARRLNSMEGVPPPPKSQTGMWSHNSVCKLLGNTRYRGWWKYGESETVWQSSKDYARQLPRTEPLQKEQIEELRIVSDDLWYAAAAKLAKEREKVSTRKPRADATPQVMDGLFHCPTHNHVIHVAGANGKYLACPICRRMPEGERPLFSHLPRVLALRLTCNALAYRIREDQDLVQRVIDATRIRAAEQQQPDPARIKMLEAKIVKLDARIGFTMRNPGETESDQAEAQALLKELRRERSVDRSELESLRTNAGRPVEIPSADEIVGAMGILSDILVGAANGTDDETAGRVRALIDRLTGSRIDLFQEGERKRHGGWLRGQFRIRSLQGLTSHLLGTELNDSLSEAEVSIDYRPTDERIPESKIQEVVQLFESDVLIKQIARQTSLGRSTVAKVLDEEFAKRGETRPDGRSRRADLAVQHQEAPLYQQIADEVAERASKDELFHEIAAAMSVNIATVRAAWTHWHEQRNLTVPDGRTRRKSLSRKSATRGSP